MHLCTTHANIQKFRGKKIFRLLLLSVKRTFHLQWLFVKVSLSVFNIFYSDKAEWIGAEAAELILSLLPKNTVDLCQYYREYFQEYYQEKQPHGRPEDTTKIISFGH